MCGDLLQITQQLSSTGYKFRTRAIFLPFKGGYGLFNLVVRGNTDDK